MVLLDLASDFFIDLDFSETVLEPERLSLERGNVYFLTSFSSFSRYTFFWDVIWAAAGDFLPGLAGEPGVFKPLPDLAGWLVTLCRWQARLVSSRRTGPHAS